MDLRFPSHRIRRVKLNTAFLSFTLMCALASSMALGCRSSAKPQLATSPLSAEQLQVYSDFLETFSALHFRRLANQTVPFVPSDLPQGSPCVQGIDLEGQSDAWKVLHRFGAEITNGKDLILVDPVEQAKLLEQKESEGATQANATKENKLKV